MNDINVAQAIASAAAEIGAVGKNQKMQAGPAKYNYRGLDDLVDAVHPILAKHQVTFSPHNITVIQEMEKTTRSGSVQYHIRAIVTYRIYGPSADYIEAAVLAEGTDIGDKAANKMMSAAYKYALGQVLSIPFSMEDQDATLSEPVTQHPTGHKQKPMTYDEALDSIRISAENLGKTVAEVTTKIREQHGGLTPSDISMVPLTDLTAFAHQLAAYADKQAT
jgi:hypothetical protein